MKELFDSRAMELANRHLLRERRNTMSYLVATEEDEAWAFSRSLFHRVVQAGVLECPAATLWRGHPCYGLLNWDAVTYPVVDWFQLVGSKLADHKTAVYALSFNPKVAVCLPFETVLRDLEATDPAPTKRAFSTGTIDGVHLADWSAFR